MRHPHKLAAAIFIVCTVLRVSGQTTVYSYTVPSGGYDSRSNPVSYTDTVNGSWTLSYDGLSRLAGASASTGPYQSLGLTWLYDSFGNRQSQTETGSPPTAGNYSEWAHFTDATNRAITSNQAVGGLSYDAAGNITFDGVNHSKYDAENRLCASQSTVTGVVTQYIYDAEGNRVAKATASTLACYTGSSTPTLTAKYIVDQSGNQMTELDGSGIWRHTNVFTDNQLLATYDTRGLHFPLTDPLGTVRVWASGLGAHEETCSSLPFGDVQSCTGTDPTEHHFTGKERDLESGSDYFGARYYSSNLGRFSSPDPSGLRYASLTNPQSLNLYSYAWNDPLVNIDPSGLDCVYIDNDTGTYGGFNSGDCENKTADQANSGYYVDGTVTNISFNSQGQVTGYDADTSSGLFDSYAGALSPTTTTVGLNPYTNALSAPGQSVNVNTTPPQGEGPIGSMLTMLIPNASLRVPDPNISHYVSAAHQSQKLTQGQINNLCLIAAQLQGGGTVPGENNYGTASSSPSEETPAQHLPVPDRSGPGLASVQIDSASARVSNYAALASVGGTWAACVGSVEAVNY